MAAAAPVPGSYLMDRGKAGDGMAASRPGGRRLPCPCSSRRVLTARTRIFSVLAVAGLVVMAVLGLSGAPVRAQPAASSVSLPPGHGGSSAARVLLIAVAVVALAAFAVLQLIARSQRRRWSAWADWRTWPPGYDPWADAGDPVAGRHEGSAYRPGYGFLPGHGLAAPPSRNVAGPQARVGIGPEARIGVRPQARAGVRPEARGRSDDRRRRSWDA